MPQTKKQPEEWERFKAFTEAVTAVPKSEVDKRSAADKRKKKRAKKKHSH